MKKVLFFIVLLIITGLNNQVFSNWYGNHPVAYVSGTETYCDTDGDTTGGSNPTFGENAVAQSNSAVSLVPSIEDIFYNVAVSGNMNCLYWDSSLPDSLSVNLSTTGWTNSNVDITVGARDRGGSSLDRIVLYENRNNAGWVNIHQWNNINISNSIVTNTYTKIPENGSEFRYRIVVYDNAGNSSAYENFNTIRFDTTIPNNADITGNGKNLDNSFFMATNSIDLSVNIGDNSGAPITSVKYRFENGAEEIFGNGNITISKDLSDVDSDLETYNYRIFNIDFTEICDAAGNCMDGLILPDYEYNIYASTIDSSNSQANMSDFTSGTSIANGDTITLNVELNDIYGNKIRPVRRTSTEYLRKIEVEFDYNNTVDLDQFIGLGNGVKITDINGSTFSDADNTIVSDIFSNLSDNGMYNLGFKFYTPTNPNNHFDLNGLRVNLLDDLNNDLFSGDDYYISSVPFNISPFYYGVASGQILDGFKEGVTQSGSINLVKNGTKNYLGVKEINLVQTGSASSYFTGSVIFNGYDQKLLSNQEVNYGNIDTLINYDVFTNFKLDDVNGFIDDLKDVEVKNYISYRIDGLDVKYSIYNYNTTNSQSFNTLKIFGNTNIDADKQLDLIENQNVQDIQNLDGFLNKSELKSKIRKNAILATKKMDTSTGSLQILNLTGSEWNKVDNHGEISGSILYIGGIDGNVVELGDNTDKSITGKKTIVIRGGNLHITSNLVNSDINSILGIIVLKDNNGKGGKIYIDTKVQKIDAILYTDKSLIGYNINYNNGDSDSISRHETDGNTGLAAVSDQLYIYGSLFSENTIGGSRLVNPLCPYWVGTDGIICSENVAQRYDLNYLRADYKNKYYGSYGDYPIIIKYNSNIQDNPPPLFEIY